MFKKLALRIFVGAAILVVGFGSREAYAASRLAVPTACGGSNWCSPSNGGITNCVACCQSFSYESGLCFGFEEEEAQRCLCTS